MFVIRILEKNNFSDFLILLRERGEAPEDYYRWKYLSQPSKGLPSGFIAYFQERPVGCVGIINRIYRAKDGKEYPATWFADWFVKDIVRGQGIGVELLKEVRKTSSYNFGIPGPLKAQIVCNRAGYDALNGLSQYTLYVNSFRCGYNRFAGSRGVKFLRGMKCFLYSTPIKLRLFTSKSFDNITFGFLEEQRWSTQTNKVSVNKGYLKRTLDYIKWLKCMPISSPRIWWNIENDEICSCGYIETDFWGLKRAVIMDIQANDLSKYIWKISATLAGVGVDFITFTYFSKSLSLKNWSRSALPFYAVTATPIDMLHITDLDKESSWRNFLFV